MTTLDLIAAISAARAEDLEHSERQRSGKRRTGARLLLTAAVLAVLTATVFAIPTVRNALFGVETTKTFVSRVFVTEGQADFRESAIDVALELQMDANAPARIETCYVPMLPAQQWDAIPLTLSGGETLSFRANTLLQWQNGNGDYVRFRQFAMPSYNGQYTFDSVSTGFDAEYSVSQIELGGYAAQRITVEPSSIDDLGFHAEHAGLQKLYWSDGRYVFTMEVNRDMTDAMLASILESIQPVEDLTPYVAVRYENTVVLPIPSIHLEQILFPERLPEGYVQTDGVQTADGGYLFLWCDDAPIVPNVLELSIVPAGTNEWTMKDWETSAAPYEKTTQTVGEYPVVCYQREKRAQLLWTWDGVDYTLKSSGASACSVSELLQILQSCAATKDIEQHLLND